MNDGTVTVMLSPGITIAAEATTDSYSAGEFMFLQICTTTLRWYTDATGNSYYRANAYVMDGQNFDGPLLDYDGQHLGAPFAYANNNSNYSVYVGPNGSLPTPPWNYPAFTDAPAFARDDTVKFLSASEDFATYLMYKSAIQGSVWIALSEVDWSWSEDASQPFPQPDPDPSPQPPPEVKTPSGPDMFPDWVNTVPNLTQSNWAAGKPPGA